MAHILPVILEIRQNECTKQSDYNINYNSIHFDHYSMANRGRSRAKPGGFKRKESKSTFDVKPILFG